MNDSKRVKSNLVTSIIAYAVSVVIGLVLPRFFTLTYGSEVNGLLGSVNQYVVYLGLFEAGIGMATLQVLYKPVASDDKNRINSVMNAAGAFYRKAGAYYLAGLLILCFGYPVVFPSELDYFTVVGVIFFSGFANVLNFWLQGKYTVLLRAEGKTYISTSLTMVTTVLSGVLRIVLISLKVNVVIILAASFAISTLSMLFVFIYMKMKYPWLDVTVAADYAAIGQKKYVLAHDISWLVFSNTDIIILTAVCGFKVVSVYTMYKLVVTQLGNLLTMIPSSIEFSLGQTFNTDREQFIRKLDVSDSIFSTAYHTIYSVALFLFIPFMKLYTKNITDTNYIDYWVALLFVSIEILSNARVMTTKVIDFAGHFKLTLSRTIAESTINLAVSIAAVFAFGIRGVLAGTVVALLYRTNDIIIYANRRILGRSPAKTYSIHLINLALLVAFQFIYSLFIRDINNYWIFMLCGFIMTVVTCATMSAVQIAVYPDLRRFVSESIGKFLGRKNRK